MDADRKRRLDEVSQVAVRVEAETEVPAAAIVAQWATESKWGAEPVGHANYFGIKRAARHTAFCIVTTHEYFTHAQLEVWDHAHPAHPARVVGQAPDGRARVELDDEFADYDSLEASVRDYAWLMSNGGPYHAAWTEFLANRNVAAFIAGIARTYSTSPSYTQLVTGIANQSNVIAAIADARAEVPA